MSEDNDFATSYEEFERTHHSANQTNLIKNSKRIGSMWKYIMR
ncbi:hypothetical protein HID58_005948 [Brassica napus]|uniref:Uncharacterized protein n=1 Tax=Brassica napus TaxID=3708 RepID=A0ABQ8EA19_BRANA|nr:hypothetical protein HID58_005948 [Brassica napus]